MTLDSNPPASGLLARLTGVLLGPRRAMQAAVQAGVGSVVTAWAVVLLVWLAAGAWLLVQPVGRQAVVDEQVRVVEALGRQVDDAQYATWQARPPWRIYLVSGGRTLLFPVTTLAVGAGLWLWTRRLGAPTRFVAALSIAVHASVVLALQQLVATPLHLVRESLTSPFNLAALLPFFDEGSLPARVLGTVELFGLWWAWLLAVGVAALVGRPARHLAGAIVGVYLVVAAAVAGAVVLIGGS
ncbi:MAG: YIP1 family protein [Vicinamibacterales bacterium]